MAQRCRIRRLGKVSDIRLSKARSRDAPLPALPARRLAVRVSPASAGASLRGLASAIPPGLPETASEFHCAPEPRQLRREGEEWLLDSEPWVGCTNPTPVARLS